MLKLTSRDWVTLCVVAVIGALVVLYAHGRLERPEPPSDKPNVLLICVDALRYDRCTTDVTPYLWQFSESEWTQSYPFAYSAAPWTVPSIGAFFSGKLPSDCEMTRAGSILAPEHQTLAEIFNEAGWTTAAITANQAIKRGNGLGRGFLFIHCAGPSPWRKGSDIIAEAIRLDLEAPWFLYLHLMDTHLPYRPVEMAGMPLHGLTLQELREGIETDLDAEQARALYDGCATEVDAEIGRLIGHLRNNGKLNETVVMVFADHGEELGEDGEWGHGQRLSDHVMHVPLIFFSFEREPLYARSETVSLVDAGNLILHAVGLPLRQRESPGLPTDEVIMPTRQDIEELRALGYAQ